MNVIYTDGANKCCYKVLLIEPEATKRAQTPSAGVAYCIICWKKMCYSLMKEMNDIFDNEESLIFYWCYLSDSWWL